MGHRFVFIRMPVLDDNQRLEHARRALGNLGREQADRDRLAGLVETVLDGLDLSLPSPAPDARLPFLADLVTRCRSVIERDGWDHVIVLVRCLPADAPPHFQGRTRLARSFESCRWRRGGWRR